VLRMNSENILDWPSGDCKPVLATPKTPVELVREFGIATFRDRDDLDWFDGAALHIGRLGPILIMRHENNPRKLTAIYVDAGCTPFLAETTLIEYFDLMDDDVVWRLSTDHVEKHQP
jgi:hypothetical protein